MLNKIYVHIFMSIGVELHSKAELHRIQSYIARGGDVFPAV